MEEPITYELKLNHYQINAILGCIGTTCEEHKDDLRVQNSCANICTEIASQTDHELNMEVLTKPLGKALVVVMKTISTNYFNISGVSGNDVTKAMEEARLILKSDDDETSSVVPIKS